MTHHFTRTICFQDLNDYEADAKFSADDDGNVSLESVQLGDTEIRPIMAEAIMGKAQYEAQIEAVQDWWCAEGWTEAEQDAADDYGDYRYEQMRDARMEAAE